MIVVVGVIEIMDNVGNHELGDCQGTSNSLIISQEYFLSLSTAGPGARNPLLDECLNDLEDKEEDITMGRLSLVSITRDISNAIAISQRLKVCWYV